MLLFDWTSFLWCVQCVRAASLPATPLTTLLCSDKCGLSLVLLPAPALPARWSACLVLSRSLCALIRYAFRLREQSTAYQEALSSTAQAKVSTLNNGLRVATLLFCFVFVPRVDFAAKFFFFSFRRLTSLRPWACPCSPAPALKMPRTTGMHKVLSSNCPFSH